MQAQQRNALNSSSWAMNTKANSDSTSSGATASQMTRCLSCACLSATHVFTDGSLSVSRNTLHAASWYKRWWNGQRPSGPVPEPLRPRWNPDPSSRVVRELQAAAGMTGRRGWQHPAGRVLTRRGRRAKIY
jgi:hypothetical protein